MSEEWVALNMPFWEELSPSPHNSADKSAPLQAAGIPEIIHVRAEFQNHFIACVRYKFKISTTVAKFL